MKKYFAAAAGLGMVLASAMPAFAADCANDTTGPYSLNKCVQEMKTKIHSRITNFADIGNSVDNSSTTGNNSSDYNTVGGDNTSTGNATSNTDITNIANDNNVTVNQTSGDQGSSTGINTITGPFSYNKIKISNIRSIHVDVDNTAIVSNNVTSNQSTGGNSSDFNTMGGGIHTGHASSTTTIGTSVNTNTVTITQ